MPSDRSTELCKVLCSGRLESKHLPIEVSLGETVNYSQALSAILQLTPTFNLHCSHAILDTGYLPVNACLFHAHVISLLSWCPAPLSS